MSKPSTATPPVKRAPTLYLIILIKLCKGLLLLFLALGVYGLTDNNLPADFRKLVLSLHFDPERKFFTDLVLKLQVLTPKGIGRLATGTLIYSLFSLMEGVGLVFRISWIGWVAIGESAFFVPIELYELGHAFSLTLFVILLINVVIVWYLFQNRGRLFRHHAH